MSKTGRNDPCVCGSGKKYKKCCLSIARTSSDTGLQEHLYVTADKELDSKETTLLTTTTSEPFMHVRLYYRVHNRSELLRKLSNLRCIDVFEETAFILNYAYEANDIPLKVKSNQLPKHLQPIILAKGKFVSDESMTLDLRSFERATCIIEFLDGVVGRDFAEITHIATHNKLHKVTKYTATEVMNVNYDDLFSEENLDYSDKGFTDLITSTEKTDCIEERGDLLLDFISHLDMSKPSLVEKFPVHYYDDGVNALKCMLSLRQRLAYEHMQGNQSLNMFQLIAKIIPGITDDLEAEAITD